MKTSNICSNFVSYHSRPVQSPITIRSSPKSSPKISIESKKISKKLPKFIRASKYQKKYQKREFTRGMELTREGKRNLRNLFTKKENKEGSLEQEIGERLQKVKDPHNKPFKINPMAKQLSRDFSNLYPVYDINDRVTRRKHEEERKKLLFYLEEIRKTPRTPSMVTLYLALLNSRGKYLNFLAELKKLPNAFLKRENKEKKASLKKKAKGKKLARLKQTRIPEKSTPVCKKEVIEGKKSEGEMNWIDRRFRELDLNQTCTLTQINRLRAYYIKLEGGRPFPNGEAHSQPHALQEEGKERGNPESVRDQQEEMKTCLIKELSDDKSEAILGDKLVKNGSHCSIEESEHKNNDGNEKQRSAWEDIENWQENEMTEKDEKESDSSFSPEKDIPNYRSGWTWEEFQDRSHSDSPKRKKRMRIERTPSDHAANKESPLISDSPNKWPSEKESERTPRHFQVNNDSARSFGVDLPKRSPEFPNQVGADGHQSNNGEREGEFQAGNNEIEVEHEDEDEVGEKEGDFQAGNNEIEVEHEDKGEVEQEEEKEDEDEVEHEEEDEDKHEMNGNRNKEVEMMREMILNNRNNEAQRPRNRQNLQAERREQRQFGQYLMYLMKRP